MDNRRLTILALALAAAACTSGRTTHLADGRRAGGPAGDRVEGWLDWRGPLQTGVSLEKGLVDTIEVDGDTHLWSFEIHGRGTPVVANGRVYAMGYSGEDKDLREGIFCLDAATGETIWEDRWSDFISDVIYDRYAIGSPAVDPETGDVFAISTAGLHRCYSADGELRWEVSAMEELGRLTFPNGRTGSPLVDGERVIVHMINAHWGRGWGPAADRFYAFDKHTGEVVWGCTPGVRPIDSSFCRPAIEDRNGRRVLYATTGCGNVVAIDARTGQPLWRFQLSNGGMNSAPVIHGDSVIAIHGKENVDTSTAGRMVSLPLGTVPEEGAAGPVVLAPELEEWRADLVAFTSSPVLAGDRVYVTIATGELCCVNANTGEVLWHHKLAPDQVHASPVYADGKLYVPMTNGSFHVLRPSDEGVEVLSSVQLAGNCFSAPAVCDGRIFVHTTDRLYCFGSPKEGRQEWPIGTAPKPGAAAQLQIVPADAFAHTGETLTFRVRTLDAHGVPVSGGGDPAALGGLTWKAPASLRESAVEGDSAMYDAVGSGVGQVTASYAGMTGSARVRIVDDLPLLEDFEGIQLDKPGSDGSKVGFPPSSWIGVFKKWEVVDLDGNKVMRRTLNMPLFQRAMGFCGHPDMSNYTVQVDVMTDGNRRILSGAGVVNQRYLFHLFGNYQAIQISSNDERIRERVPFKIQPKVWYTLKTRVDVAEDGSGVIRGKVWQRDEPEPDAWTIEVEHADAHTHGAPGLYGFTPQSRFHAYVDNYSVTPND